MKKKIIFLQGSLSPYRINFFNELSEIYDTTIISHTDISQKDFLFTHKVFKKVKILNFVFSLGLLNFINKKNPATIIIPDHIRYISFLLARIFVLKRNKIDWIWYGVDVKPKKNLFDLRYFSRYIFFKTILRITSDKFTFYDQKSKLNFDEIFQNNKRTFLVRNTVSVKQKNYHKNPNRKNFINIGRLEKRKNNNLLINSFKRCINKIPENINLIFIGDGPEEKNLKKQVSKLNLNSRIKFFNGTYSEKKIEKYYESAIATISYGQAGLAILQSFGHGVCFITTKDAISGGEISNINNFENGILIDNKENEIDNIICLLANNKYIAEYLGENAYFFYKNNATLKNMVTSIQMLIK